MNPIRRRRSDRGYLLIIILWVLAMLSLIAYSMSFSVRANIRIADNSLKQAQSRYVALAGIEHAIAALMQDANAETEGDEAWREPANFQEVAFSGGFFDVAYPDARAETGIVYGLDDEAGKLNINVATKEQLMMLPGMTDSMADSLIDWIDGDDIPGPFGAETDYYSALPDPYEAKNAQLSTVRELLFVKDFDETILYGAAAGAAADAPESESALEEGLIRYITVYSSDRNIQNTGAPRVNIQTADAQALRNGLSGLSQQDAEAIVAYRGQNAFQSIADLLNVTRPQEEQEESGERQNIVRGGGEGQGAGQGSGGRGQSSVQPAGRSQQGSSVQQSSAVGRRGGGGGGARGQGGGGGGERIFNTDQLRQWADAITVSSETVIPGLININTAPPEVLATIPGLTEDDVNQIGLLRATTAFASVGDLFEIPGMTVEKFREASPRVTARSFQFRAQSRGWLASGRSAKRIETVLERDENGVRILYWRES